MWWGPRSRRSRRPSIIKIEKPDEEEPFIPHAARMGAAFLHGAAVTIHKAQGSQWDDGAGLCARSLRRRAVGADPRPGCRLWKRLAYVAITRARDAAATGWCATGWRGRRRPLTMDDLRASRRLWRWSDGELRLSLRRALAV